MPLYASGKEFFRFTTNLTETIRNVHVNNLAIWAAGEYVSNMVRGLHSTSRIQLTNIA